MSGEADDLGVTLADPQLPFGRPRTYLGDTGAAVVVALFLLFVVFLVLYTCSTALDI